MHEMGRIWRNNSKVETQLTCHCLSLNICSRDPFSTVTVLLETWCRFRTLLYFKHGSQATEVHFTHTPVSSKVIVRFKWCSTFLIFTIDWEVPAGLSVIADAKLPSNTTIVTCPFSLAITEDSARQSLLNLLNLTDLIAAKSWTERQWITSYLCFHWIDGDSRCFHFLLHREPGA